MFFGGGNELKNHRALAMFATLIMAAILPLTTLATTGQAASLNPSATQLKQSKQYYQRNAKALANRYKLNFALQTALTRQGTTRVYVKSNDPELKKSANLAISYWNQKLGRKTFIMGTKARHNLTVTMTAKNTSADAWWSPASRQIQLEQADYKAQTGKIRAKMVSQTTTKAVNNANQKIKAYGHTISKRADYAHLYNTYRATQINSATKQIKTQKQNIVKQKIDVKARTFNYANIIAHEMGHSLGLMHSPNAADAMNAKSSTPQIYDYAKVKASKKGFNQLGKTDVNRAKLALKIHAAKF